MRPEPAAPFQERFHRRWGHLRDVHVRALAWLVDAPGLLEPDAARWDGRIATLECGDDVALQEWLQQLDAAPQALHAALAVQPTARLGRYAEQLMTFHLQHAGRLVAHNLQVRDGNITLGEFDFLLDDGQGGLLHWEFATKFYLLESASAAAHMDGFVGPNLADSLGAKMNKIMDQQLRLSANPAAIRQLASMAPPNLVRTARALVKGWLFYRDGAMALPQALGVAPGHCRGFWCTLGELDASAPRYAILPRLQWLAPARLQAAECFTFDELTVTLAAHFAGSDTAPVMVALLKEGMAGEAAEAAAFEYARGFIVADDWRERAAERLRHGIVDV